MNSKSLEYTPVFTLLPTWSVDLSCNNTGKVKGQRLFIAREAECLLDVTLWSRHWGYSEKQGCDRCPVGDEPWIVPFFSWVVYLRYESQTFTSSPAYARMPENAQSQSPCCVVSLGASRNTAKISLFCVAWNVLITLSWIDSYNHSKCAPHFLIKIIYFL